jgi:hypothetical protein
MVEVILGNALSAFSRSGKDAPRFPSCRSEIDVETWRSQNPDKEFLLRWFNVRCADR